MYIVISFVAQLSWESCCKIDYKKGFTVNATFGLFSLPLDIGTKSFICRILVEHDLF